MSSEHPPTPEGTFRVGHDIPRNLYDGDKDIGRIDTAEYAAQIVDALNGSQALRQELTEAQRQLRWLVRRLDGAIVIGRVPYGDDPPIREWLVEAENHHTTHRTAEDAASMARILMQHQERDEREQRS